MLSPSLAQEIAADTSAVIGFNVLITDDEGIVIGSGDTRRIGSFHEASVEVLRSKLAAEHNAVQAQELRGVRPGMTLPLIMDGQAVGTVGLTGTPGQVRRFGLVVKRQIEILLRESVSIRSGVLRDRVLEDLLADIASYDERLVEQEFIVHRAAEAGFDLRLPRVAVCIQVSASDPLRQRGRSRDVTLLRPELLRVAREAFADPQDIVACTMPGWIGVLHRVSSADTPSAWQRVVDLVGARHGLTARVGVGEPAFSIAGLRDSYQDAWDALRLGARIAPDVSVNLIGDLRAHQILVAAGYESRSLRLGPVTADLRAQADWRVLRATIIAWCEAGFGLVAAASALHIHRNTLVYRLGKIERITGRPLREHRATLTLYLACLADQLDDAD
jgi:carbohydrate diacid regulator